MSRTPPHPTREQIELPTGPGLSERSDPVGDRVSARPAGNCQQRALLRRLQRLSGKSNLTYHFAKLRDCGLMQTRVAGTNRFMRLRREDLEARFPGLLDAVLKSAAKDADRLQLVAECDVVEAV